jgi:hypothetical protein
MELFKRPHHNQLASALLCLDTDMLAKSGCYYGGGTAIAMAFGEKRTSFDIDFLATNDSMSLLKDRISKNGLASIFKRDVKAISEPVLGRYMIKGLVQIDGGKPLKLEIMEENSSHLIGVQGLIEALPNIVTVNKPMMIAQKIMAAMDRGLEKEFNHRDFWDLCVLANNSSKKDFKQAEEIISEVGYTPFSANSFSKIQKEAKKDMQSDFDFLEISDKAYMLKGDKKLSSLLGLNMGIN